jgi:hypothetical protein
MNILDPSFIAHCSTIFASELPEVKVTDLKQRVPPLDESQGLS